MRKLMMFAMLCLLTTMATAQNVTNVRFEQDGKMVKIYYDLSKKADVRIYLSINGGRSYESSPLCHISGNVGEKVRPGKKRCAVWDVTADRENLSSDNICFKVVAREHLRGRKAKIRAAEEAAAAAAEARRLEEERLEAEAAVKRAIAQGEKRIFTVGDVTFTMIHVQGGTFSMGCTSEQGGDCDNFERPVHQVHLSDYWIGETEVTQELWKAVMDRNPSRWKGDNLPVNNISWYDAQDFCHKLSQLTGLEFRLPTEAEWEYAARGGRKSRGYKYCGSNTLSTVAWYDGQTHLVKEKQPNELGLYDMSGNVAEWCQDRFGYYYGYSQTNPTGPEETPSNDWCMLRGGNWDKNEKECRVSSRSCNNIAYGGDGRYGFRLVLSNNTQQ